MHTVGFIGAGQMARALAQGFVRAGLLPANRIVAFDPVPAAIEQFIAACPGSRSAASNVAAAQDSDVVFLAVKPQSMPAVIGELEGKVAGKLIVSIAAGIPLARLLDLKTERIVRVMPNTPCLIGKGASAYALARGATAADGELVGQFLSAVGIAFPVEEKHLDAVTGLSGSGPAFAYLVIEALADGGVKMGLPRDVALALAAHTVGGAAEMVTSQKEHPAVLKDRVTSPGGTTIAGLAALEAHGLRGALIAAVEAATKRSAELGK
jgi:pyrroline-5-carboxylate reductase